MSTRFTATLATGALALGLGVGLAQAAAPTTPQGVITEKVFLNLNTAQAGTVASLTSSPKFPNSPDITEYPGYFELWATGDINTAPGGTSGYVDYGAQMLGYFYPNVTGPFVFHICSDDESDLYLSTDDNPANKLLIAEETTWSNVRNYTTDDGGGDPTAKSSQTFTNSAWPTKDTVNGGAIINLTNGKAYYIEAQMKQGGGGDNLSVSINGVSPIPGSYLSSFDKNSGSLTIVTQPQSATINEGQAVTFSVVLDGTPPYTYQWTDNGTAVASGTNSSLTFSRAYRAENGHTFKVAVTGASGSLTSSAVTLTVVNDTTPPTLVSATSSATFDSITVTFSEPLDPASGTNMANYKVDQGVTITAATLQSPAGTPGDNVVILSTTKQPVGGTFTLTVNGVKDVPGNVIAANSTITFKSYVFATGYATYNRWLNYAAADLTGLSTALLAGTQPPPDFTEVLTAFDGPAGTGINDYESQIFCWFVAPFTGQYVFFVASDDAGDLYLSTDDTPANKKLIAQESGWSNEYQWQTVGGGSAAGDKRSDTFSASAWPTPNVITLTQGKLYYLEELHWQGGGGDNTDATFVQSGAADPAQSSLGLFLLGNVIGTYLDTKGASVTINTQPANTIGVEGRTAAFSVSATGTSPYVSTVFYDWQSAPPGSSTFTDIAGATSNPYKTPVLSLAESGTQYRVIVSVPTLSVTSSVATLTVIVDTNPPVVLGASALKNQAGTFDIGVQFDKLLNVASATTPANYALSTGTITAINWMSNSPAVILTATNLTAGGAYTVTVKNIVDYKGNKLGSTNVEFVVSSMAWGEVGAEAMVTDPTDALGPPGYVGGFPAGYAVVAVATNGFDLYSDGWGEWNNYDETTFVYEPLTGDFDKKLQVIYQDASSEWARAGLIMREDLSVIGMDVNTQDGGAGWSGQTETPVGPPFGKAGRYQKIHANPVGPTLTDANGNNSWETNRRLYTGGGSSAVNANTGVGPLYPNVWCRLQRLWSTNFNYFRSDDGATWVWMGTTTWSDTINGTNCPTECAMPATVYVGPEFSPEVGNFASAEQNYRGRFLAQMRNYGDTWGPAPKVASRTYSIGVKFASQFGATLTTPVPTVLAKTDVAGIPGLKQANWNNDTGTSGSGKVANLVADQGGTAVPTTATVTYTANDYWTTQGQGETNASLSGADQVLMNGYLDMNVDPSTTSLTISSIPAALTSDKYDVYVYAAGSVGGRGGGYHILDGVTGAVLKDWVYAVSSWYAPDFYPVPDNTSPTNYGVGNYIVFRGLSAPSITIEASTANGLGYLARGITTHRAAITAVQLVAPSTGGTTPPAPTLSIKSTPPTLTITFTGTLQSSSTLTGGGTWTDVTGATSPYVVTPSSGKQGFYRAKQ